MPVDHFTIAAGEHRDLEAELADAAAHAVHGRIVLPRVACVEDQPVDRPDLNLVGLSRRLLREHTSPSDGSDWRCLSEGALCAGLANRASNFIVQNKGSSRRGARRWQPWWACSHGPLFNFSEERFVHNTVVL